MTPTAHLTGRVSPFFLVTALAALLPATNASPADLDLVAPLPDPLLASDGSKIATREDWVRKRRPELKELFQEHMYGKLPPIPTRVTGRVDAVHDDFLGGRGTLKLLKIETSGPRTPPIDLLLVLPRVATGRVPVFLSMNFCGNHAVVADPRVPVARGWVYDSCAGSKAGVAGEAGRGSQAADWPVEQILERGYAFATFCSSDVDPDRKDVSEGVHAWVAREKDPGARPEPASRGSISAWAWGFHRAVDVLVTEAAIDPARIAAVGHSRNGKTAIWAAALDERIALAIPHQAGCGGTSPARGTVGESVARINSAFPHWFNARYKEYGAHPETLPFDQNALVALCAPRPVLLSNAEEDQWANPTGQFLVARAADPVYRLLGTSGLEARSLPPPGELSSGAIGYYIRAGKHSMTAGDWQVFLAFADRHLLGKPAILRPADPTTSK